MLQDIVFAFKLANDLNMIDECKKLRELLNKTIEAGLLEKDMQIGQIIDVIANRAARIEQEAIETMEE